MSAVSACDEDTSFIISCEAETAKDALKAYDALVIVPSMLDAPT